MEGDEETGRGKLAGWWIEVERGAEFSDPIAAGLASAARLELEFDRDGARGALAKLPDELPAHWRGPRTLISLQVEARTADREERETLYRDIDRELRAGTFIDAGTIARARLQLGALDSSLGRRAEAEEHLVAALAQAAADDPVIHRVLDCYGVVLIDQGSWIEAERTLRCLAAARLDAGDKRGAAITKGHLARLLHATGKHPDAIAHCEEALDWAPMPATALRLETLRVQSRVSLAANTDHSVLTREQASLRERREALVERAGHLRVYADLALARGAYQLGDSVACDRSLQDALNGAKRLGESALVALALYWQLALSGDSFSAEDEARLENSPPSSQSDPCTEAEVLFALWRAQRHFERGRAAECTAILERITARVSDRNHTEWQRLIDDAWQRYAPQRFQDVWFQRYTGAQRADADATRRERVTMVFADLVDFTRRSHALDAEAVMETSRNLFELVVPAMAEHQLRPVAYFGDGLLALARGDDHARRGVEFSRAVVRRAWRVSAARKAQQEPWSMALRAGVATGDVVLGRLGNLSKFEFAAIGFTTNLASRLQGIAEPYEVVGDRETALANGIAEAQLKDVKLKGLDEVQWIHRWPMSVHLNEHQRNAAGSDGR